VSQNLSFKKKTTFRALKKHLPGEKSGGTCQACKFCLTAQPVNQRGYKLPLQSKILKGACQRQKTKKWAKGGFSKYRMMALGVKNPGPDRNNLEG